MPEREEIVDVVLVGGGIMSATLAALLTTLEPTWTVEIHERRPALAEESSNAWNNAGTGHAALCELNYTPERPDGTIDISKAVTINEQFELSRELWNHLSTHDRLPGGDGFLSTTPHMTSVPAAARVAATTSSGSRSSTSRGAHCAICAGSVLNSRSEKRGCLRSVS